MPGASAKAVGIGARRALDQDVDLPPDEALRALRGNALDGLDQSLHPLALHGMRKLVAELRRLGAAARREDERERGVVANLLDHVERLLEVLLGLAGEADDDVRRDGAVGHVLADERHTVQVALLVVGAAHALEDRARSRLQRQVDVLAYGREVCMRADDVLAHVLRVRARVADALDPG